MSMPLAPFRVRLRAKHALLGSLSFFAVYACHEATSGDGAGNSSAGNPSSRNTPASQGDPSPGSGSPSTELRSPDTGVGSRSEGVPNPALGGAPTPGSATEVPTVPGMLVGSGGASGAVDPGTRVFEQDDPNLRPRDDSFER